MQAALCAAHFEAAETKSLRGGIHRKFTSFHAGFIDLPVGRKDTELVEQTGCAILPRRQPIQRPTEENAMQAVQQTPRNMQSASRFPSELPKSTAT
jgi:hypothetical protein